MKTKTLGFIGGGRITKILLQGFKNKRVEFPSIVVNDKNLNVLNELKKQFPKVQITDSLTEAAKQDVVLIALHPPVIGEIITSIKDAISANTLIISLAPKFTIKKISELLKTKKIVRMIPNATSYINKGYNPICFSNHINILEKKSIIETFQILGKTFETEERKLESYAIFSAMLPTYFWFQWLELQKISQKTGLSENESIDTIWETSIAALELLFNSGLNSEQVVDLIPVKPIAEYETVISNYFNAKLLPLYEKIKS